MKSPTVLALVISALVLSTPAVAKDGPSNPVMRVVELLQGLSAKIEKEGKVEEGLYEDFVCWGKSVISQKEASNAEAKVEIENQNQWISDLENGKVELTDERVQLEKEIGGLKSEIESATSTRTAAHEDFLKAEDDMKKAIAALDKAMMVLGTAMSSDKSASMVSIRTQVRSRVQDSAGMAALMEDAATLDRAVKLGERFLNKVDAAFLRRLLTGQVPDVNWKKLNRKATFKMSYKARSGKIMHTLKEMQVTFTTNLASARSKEEDDQKFYDELKSSKDGQLEASQTALSDMTVERGAKAMSKEEAQQVVDMLTTQMELDNKYIKQTQDAMATKREEYEARTKLRKDELAAISKAIGILYSDDARDLMKKSFTSQGYLFLQRQAVRAHTVEAAATWGKASALLRNTVEWTSDARLLNLVNLGPNETAAIKPAIDAIDNMLVTLKEEEETDLAAKESCESGRAGDTRNAIVLARDIDEASDLIKTLDEDIEELENKIKAAGVKKADTKAQLDTASKNREKENEAYKANKADDMAAADLVTQAKEVLEKFYEDNHLALGLLQKGKQPVEDVAGEAPTPPPETWDTAYMGATGSSSSIVSTMEMIYEDIMKDVAKADSEEKAAQEEFDAFKVDSEDQMKALGTEIDTLEGSKGKHKEDKVAAVKSRSTKKGELNTVLEKIKETAAAGCDYTAINYALRVKNRQIEVDSLTKAKAILLGGEFSKIDPGREMTPGDAAAASAAFLQRPGRHLRGEAQRMLH